MLRLDLNQSKVNRRAFVAGLAATPVACATVAAADPVIPLYEAWRASLRRAPGEDDEARIERRFAAWDAVLAAEATTIQGLALKLHVQWVESGPGDVVDRDAYLREAGEHGNLGLLSIIRDAERLADMPVSTPMTLAKELC